LKSLEVVLSVEYLVVAVAPRNYLIINTLRRRAHTKQLHPITV